MAGDPVNVRAPDRDVERVTGHTRISPGSALHAPSADPGECHNPGKGVVRNRRLCHAGYLWALPLRTRSPGPRAHYDRRRERGDTYSAAARHLANRFFGILYHCLQKRINYDEAKAFPPDIKIAT